MAIKINVGNVAKELTNAYINVNGVAKQVAQIWANVNGVAKLVWENWKAVSYPLSFSHTQESSGWNIYGTGYSYYTCPKAIKNFNFSVAFELYAGTSADCNVQALVNGSWVTIGHNSIGYAGDGEIHYGNFSGSYQNVEVTQLRLEVGAAIFTGYAKATCTIGSRLEKGN